MQKAYLQADALTDGARCSLLPGSAAVSEGFWWQQDTASAAVVALVSAATASSGAD